MLPLSYLFIFPLDFGFIGVWIGLPCGSIVQSTSFLFIMFTTPWKEVAMKASQHEYQEIEENIVLSELPIIKDANS